MIGEQSRELLARIFNGLPPGQLVSLRADKCAIIYCYELNK